MEEVKFRIGQGEAFGDALVRIARARVDDAIARVESPGTDRGEDLHDVRTTCKRLRAIWRLARPHIVGDLYRIENARLAETARRLSGARDARIAAETLRGLEVGGLEAVLARFEASQPTASEVEAMLASTVGDLRQTGEAIAHVAFPAGDWDCLRPGLRKTYRQARDLALELEDGDEDGRFHECRKQVKYLWYQLRLLEDRAPIADREAGLRDLQKDLGDDHDLVVTRGMLLEGHENVRAMLVERSEALRKRIRRAVEPVFDRPPKAFVAHLESGA